MLKNISLGTCIPTPGRTIQQDQQNANPTAPADGRSMSNRRKGMKICVKMIDMTRYSLRKRRQNSSFCIISYIHHTSAVIKSIKINIFAYMNRYTATAIFSILFVAVLSSITALCTSAKQAPQQPQPTTSCQSCYPVRGGKKCRNCIFDEDSHAMNVALHLYTKFKKSIKKACGPDCRPNTSCGQVQTAHTATDIINPNNTGKKTAGKLIYILCRIQI